MRRRDDNGRQALAPFDVGQADDGDLLHRRVVDQHVLDLGRRDVLAPADDGVVRPALDEQVPAGVKAGPVPGGKPAVGVEDGSQPQVLPGDLAAAHPQLADFAGTGGRAGRVADLALHPGNETTRGGQPGRHRRVGRQECRTVIIWAEDRDRRTRLGEPVGVDEAGVWKCGECLLQDRTRHPGAAVGDRAQRRCRCPRTGELLDDAGQHRRYDHGAGHLLRGHQAQPGARGEIRQVDETAAGVDVRQHGPDTGDVIRRNAGQCRLGRLRGAELDGLQDVGDEVGVPQHNRFRLGRRPAGEQQDRRRVIIDIHRLGRLRERRGGQPLLTAVDLQTTSGHHVLVGLVADDDRAV